ncbi:MAG: hypothetical protein KGJ13_03435 [Patescibacteria group bacterium]|nr:hypothetical protein [Patescibacteria group bacterium]
MKTKEELTEDAGLVRDIEDWCGCACADDTERNFRDALFRKAFAELPNLIMPHVRRLNRALCEMEFPSNAALGLRKALLNRIAMHHNLKQYRNVKMPEVTQSTK